LKDFVARCQSFTDRVALVSEGKPHTYAALLHDSKYLAQFLLGDQPDLLEARVAFFIPSSYAYVQTQWAIWRAGGIAVPLCTSHPLPSLEYTIRDTGAQLLITTRAHEPFLRPLTHSGSLTIFCLEDLPHDLPTYPPLPEINSDRKAMILYTSGTTNLPKGVVSTHQNIQAQMQSLVDAWEWSAEDHILNVLPLHHVHGIVNVLCCALWSGASCTLLPKFDPQEVWEHFQNDTLTLFMAVPTIYFKLIAYYEQTDAATQQVLRTSCGKFRLMVSGSAALPVSVLEKWQTLSGHTLLERYGMTEIGMALSNPYRGTRRAGHVGLPLPGIQVRLVNEANTPVDPGQPGEIQVKGDTVFEAYWQKPEATKDSFTEDGWFRTGDIAVRDEDSYKILGRNSVDIIKSGAYKISALEIEEVLRQHPEIRECGVVGLPDEEWGEIIAAALVVRQPLDESDLKAWLKTQMPAYRIPRKYIYLDDLPRNALGKVTKNELKGQFK
jgi:malonyl-CoA/methylmalonyl-CoA synthetase